MSFLVLVTVAGHSSTASTAPSGNTWKAHGQIFDRFQNVVAFANERNGKYQCTELVHRFLKQTYGVPTSLGIGIGHANVMIQNVFSRFGGKTYRFRGQPVRMRLMKNGSGTEAPGVGSAINFASGGYGHVAIVRQVEALNPTTVRIFLFEQHGFPRWQVGEAKPIRSVTFRMNRSGTWSSGNTPGVGTPIAWINFVSK